MASILGNEAGGISKKARSMLTKVINQSKGCFNAQVVQEVLQISRSLALKYLSRWAKNGWIQRVHQGTYLPLELTTEDGSAPNQDPWVVAEGLFAPCYMGGWTGAHYWGFTDQIFNETLVLSTSRVLRKKEILGGFHFIVKKIPKKQMFGLEVVWKDAVKVNVSDPHKTIIDILNHPQIGGGIRSLMDILWQYLQSPHKRLDILWEYAMKIRNKTVFKRLGYLLSILKYEDLTLIDRCKANISKGYSQLDPSIKGDRLIRQWALAVPSSLVREGL